MDFSEFRRRHPLPALFFRTVGATIGRLPLSAITVRFWEVLDLSSLENHHKAKFQPVILSKVELLRVERKRTSRSAKREAVCGISYRVLVACQRDVTSIQKATQILNEIPAALWRLGFSSLLARKNFDKLRMTGWLFGLQ